MSERSSGLRSRYARSCCSPIALACAYVSLTAAAAHAQPADASAQAPDGGGEIVVTALKRDSRLLDAPASISALGGDSLRDQQITEVADLTQKIPGLVFTEQNGISQISIRGVSLTTQVGGLETPVAMHFNGVYLPSAAPLEFLFMDIGSVETLRGPQGTLYGRNATGGAINFIPAAPNAEWGGFVDASYGNYDTYRLEGAVTGPIAGDALTFRLSGLADGRAKGYVTNLETGNRLGEYRERGVRGTLRFAPSDLLTIDATGFAFHRRANSSELGYPLAEPRPFMIGLNPDYGTHELSLDPRRVRLNTEGSAAQRDHGAIVTASLKPSDSFSIVSRTAYLHLKNRQSEQDCDSSQIETCIGNQFDDSRSFQQEINLLGEVGASGLEYVIGGYYGREEQDWSRAYVFANSAQGYVDIGGGFPLPNGTLSLNEREQVTKSHALFADLTYRLSDSFALLGGARWSKDKREGDFTFLFDVPGFGAFGNCENFSPTASAEASWDAMTFKAGAQFKPDQRSQFYAQFQQGFKSGGFNPASCGAEFKPEKVNAYEIGYKAELFDRKLTLGLAAFHYDYTNMQVYVILPGGNPAITNAASSVIDGVEVSASVRPTRDLTIDVAANWLPRAKYNDTFLNTYTLDPTQSLVDLNGNRLPSAPRLSLNGGIEYRFNVGEGHELRLRGELYYNSGMFFTAFNTPLTRQPSYVLANAFLTFKPADGNWDIRAWVRNIADKKYLISAYDNNISFYEQGSQSPPRSYGIGVHFEF